MTLSEARAWHTAALRRWLMCDNSPNRNELALARAAEHDAYERTIRRTYTDYRGKVRQNPPGWGQIA